MIIESDTDKEIPFIRAEHHGEIDDAVNSDLPEVPNIQHKHT